MRRRTQLTVFLCLVAIVFIALPHHRWALRLLYPLRFPDVLVTEARKQQVNPLLVAAIARVESGFNPAAVSSKGAIGLMQVMPATGAWIAEQLQLPNWRDERLFDPHTNLRVGIWYLAYLQKRFAGNEVQAIAAYNGGASNVSKWISSGRWDGTARDYNRIPFRETRLYVARVLRAYEWYRKAYPHLATAGKEGRQSGSDLARLAPGAGVTPYL